MFSRAVQFLKAFDVLLKAVDKNFSLRTVTNANASDQATYPHRVDFWQYSDQGQVPGIEGYVDLDLYFP